MKRLMIISFFVLLLAGITAPAAFGQNWENPANVPPYNCYTLTTWRAYENSDVDTLPQPRASDGFSTGLKIGGVRDATITFQAKDSCVADLYVDYKMRGNTTWTNSVYADSIKLTDAGYKELILRSATANNLGGMDREIRVRVAYRSAGNGVTNDSLKATLNWKP